MVHIYSCLTKRGCVWGGGGGVTKSVGYGWNVSGQYQIKAVSIAELN